MPGRIAPRMKHGATSPGRRRSESAVDADATYLGRQHVVLEPEQQRAEPGHSRHHRPQMVRAPESDLFDDGLQRCCIPSLAPQVRNGQLPLKLIELSLLQIRCINGYRKTGHERAHVRAAFDRASRWRQERSRRGSELTVVPADPMLVLPENSRCLADEEDLRCRKAEKSISRSRSQVTRGHNNGADGGCPGVGSDGDALRAVETGGGW